MLLARGKGGGKDMTNQLIAFNAFLLGCHSVGLLWGVGVYFPPVIALCAAAFVYHAITLRRWMREGVQL